MSRRLVVLLAVACGASVANLYYAQPLLDTIAGELNVSPSTAALVVTASQIGYAAGLLFIVPLGDLLDARRLVTRMLVITAVGLGAAAAAPQFAVLAIAIAIVGVTSTVAQVLIPLASSLAPEDERGRVVGNVMSGLLIGILAARTVAGFVAELGGWRLVYALAAGIMLLLTVALYRALPTGRPAQRPPYWELLRSIGTLVREEPGLRRRMAYGACGMATFSVLWTALALLLARAPFDYNDAQIGLFGLAGLAGAGAAQAAGRLADRGLTGVATAVFWAIVAASWVLLAAGRESALAIALAVITLDLGVQGQHILNQSTIYALRPDARSRVTTAYMTTNFLTGALASAATAVAWDAGGWSAVCAIGGAISVVALLVVLDERGWVRRGTAAGVPSGAPAGRRAP